MNPESKSRLLSVAEVVGLCVAVLVIGLLIGVYVIGGRDAQTNTGGPTGTDGQPTSNTRGEVPADIRIPDAGEEQSGELAVPTMVTEAAPGVEARLRSYTIEVNGNSFSPSQVAVRQGDTTRIIFRSLDKDYDFVQPDLGLSRTLPQGQDSIVEVSPQTTGQFTFYCSSCGGPDSGPVGYLIVVPR